MQSRKAWIVVGALTGAALACRAWRRRVYRRSSPVARSAEPRSAVVTGASSGIGRAYAEHLASLGYDLLLVARREALLQALADELASRYRVSVEVLVADLSDPEAVARVAARISALPNLNMLVNNAGFGAPGAFADADPARQDAMIQVHVAAANQLARAALPLLLAQHSGAIVNVSSLVAFYPLSGSAVYAATKSYLKSFAEALHQELAGTGVRVQALCPGFTETEFPKSPPLDAKCVPAGLWMDPAEVVSQSIRDLEIDRVVSVPGVGYRLLASLSPLVPRGLLYAVGRRFGGQRAHPVEPFPKRHYESAAEALKDLRYVLQHGPEMRNAMRLLDAHFRHRLLLAVTQVNQCRYCSYVHTRSALQDGMSPEEVAELLEGTVEHCPPHELPALAYAQHWAESSGHPDEDLRARLIEVYGAQQAEAIESVLRMIRMGNYSGNAFDSWLYRISRGRWGT